MAKFILGKKLNMTQKFLDDGQVMPVTVVGVGPCTVVQVKGDKDGYQAVQIGFGNKKKLNKALTGHLKGLNNFRYLQEYRLDNTEGFFRGQMFDISSFVVGDILKISAVSKGKGFQGVVRRHGFHGSPATHGHKDQLRMPGSIGSTDSNRVFKGTRMGGRMGGQQVTVSNLELIAIDPEKNLLYIKGAVPGARGTLVNIMAEGDIKFVEKKKEEIEVKDVQPQEKPATKTSLPAKESVSDKQADSEEIKKETTTQKVI